jgi:hypothetical protein
MNIFYLKYLKYKQKYLDCKNILDSNVKHNDIIKNSSSVNENTITYNKKYVSDNYEYKIDYREQPKR